MKILVACEFSGIVRNAFRKRGHDAWSCDLLPCESDPSWHREQDVYTLLGEGWDMMIAHPPCTHLAVSGARWFKDKREEQQDAIDFVRLLLNAPIKYIALENPISIISTKIRKPDFITQPYLHGDPFQKTTCFWLKNLPKLIPTSNLTERTRKVWLEPPSPERWKNRSRTYPGLAKSMAEQWGDFVASQLKK